MKKIEVRYLSQEDVISLNIGWGDVIRLCRKGLCRAGAGNSRMSSQKGNSYPGRRFYS